VSSHLNIVLDLLFVLSLCLFLTLCLLCWHWLLLLVPLDRLDQLGLVVRQDLATGLDQVQEVFSELEHVVGGRPQLLSVVEEALEVVERDLADFRNKLHCLRFVRVHVFYLLTLKSNEKIVKAVVFTSAALFHELVLFSSIDVDHLN
jgi:hypothetical protein